MNPSIFDIWCKLCALTNAVIAMCGPLANIITNMTTISMNNIEIKTCIENLVGDPDAECPDCPEPTAAELAQTEITQATVAQTEAMQAATTELQVKTAAVLTKLGKGDAEKSAEKEAAPVTNAAERSQ